jgi:protein-tyrosine phosphatase
MLQSQLRKVSARTAADSGHTTLLRDLYEHLPVQERLSYKKLGNLFDDENQGKFERRQRRSSTTTIDRKVLDPAETNIEETKFVRKTTRQLTVQAPLEDSFKSRASDFSDIMADRYFSCDEPGLGHPYLSDSMSLIDLTEERVTSDLPFSLFISGLKVANDATKLIANHIYAVLSLGKGNDPTHLSSIKYLNLPFESGSTSIRPVFDAAVRFITAHLHTGNVLVSCYHGQSRSYAVVIAFLVKQFHLELPDAVAKVHSARGALEISRVVMSELEAFSVSALS